MRISGAFFLIVLFASCEFFGGGKPTKEELVSREIKNINWNEVDQYPLFEDCDETASKDAQIICFQDIFIQQVFGILRKNQIIVHKNLNDTVKVHMLITNKGAINILDIQKSAAVEKQIPQLDSIVNESIKQLPKLYPALKRNIPVSTKIKLPIVLKAG